MYNYPLFEFPLYSIALASKMVEVARFHEIDLIHAHYAIPHATSAYLAREILKKEKCEKKLKVITTLHGTDITLIGLEPSFLETMRFSIEESDGVTAVSNFLKEKTLTAYQVNKEIEVIPNFIDIDKYKAVESNDACHFRKSIAPNGERILVHISNFRPLKRVQDVVKIFSLIREEIPSKLLLIGDGPDRSECERISRDLNIYDHIKFMGKQDSIAELLSISDIFLMPSQSESFGLSALEAMSCGIPAITSSVGGLPELNLHGETGYIAEIGDTKRMARYAIELFKNEKKLKQFKANARKRAEEFKTEKIIPMYENFYEKVLKK